MSTTSASPSSLELAKEDYAKRGKERRQRDEATSVADPLLFVVLDDGGPSSFNRVSTLAGLSFAGTGDGDGEPGFDRIFRELGVPQDVKVDFLVFLFANHLNECLYANGAVPFCVASEEAYRKSLDDGDATQGLIGTVIVSEYDPKAVRKKKNRSFFRRWFDKVREKIRETWFVLVSYHRWTGRGMPRLFVDKQYKRQSKLLSKLFNAWKERMTEWHLGYGPNRAHWYVEIVGTHPRHRGKGVAKALMAEIGTLADGHRRECYLECSPGNVPYYEKFGYREVSRQAIPGTDNNDDDESNPFPLTEGTIHLMVRPCSSAAVPSS